MHLGEFAGFARRGQCVDATVSDLVRKLCHPIRRRLRRGVRSEPLSGCGHGLVRSVEVVRGVSNTTGNSSWLAVSVNQAEKTRMTGGWSAYGQISFGGVRRMVWMS